MRHKWVDEEFKYKIGGVPTFVGSQQTVDEPFPGPPQSYRNPDNLPDGRVFPFNNGDGWKWASITYDEHSAPISKEFLSLASAKRHVARVIAHPMPRVVSGHAKGSF
jgi:hypothetical protein